MQYICDVKPHNVKDTLSVNEAKRTIKLLTQPLADISKNIADNINECQIQTENILQFKGTIEELKCELYIPVIDIKSIPLDHPMTVCSDKDCCELMNINGQVVKHYNKVCHKICYLKYDDGNVIGNEGFLDCKAFNEYKRLSDYFEVNPKDANLYPDNDMDNVDPETGLMTVCKSKRIKHDNCQKCQHCYQTHLHVKYKTNKVESKCRDESKYNQITDNQKAIEAKEEIVGQLMNRQSEYENESKFITDCMAKFAAFLKHNAMTPFNDAFEDYVKYLIRNEKRVKTFVSSGDSRRRQSVEQLEQLLQQYRHEKRVILESMKRGDKNYCTITLDDIQQCVTKLYELPLNGQKIQELLNMQLSISDKIHINSQQKVIELPVQIV
ncbi:uncharacterized protein LOC128963700 [Oppia nitens]|uniref:uncharacterized protein LOC128963700 n=1 Tax=Oppia nitens TaxID=1686743 RepID=UPI0023DA21F5|nr:uncharacterized protein LOC128963700 [Oppia nitens]